MGFPTRRGCLGRTGKVPWGGGRQDRRGDAATAADPWKQTGRTLASPLLPLSTVSH